MVTRDLVENVIAVSGLWDEGRRNSHGFLLSPDVYEITKTQAQELEDLGQALYECLSGLGRIAAICADPRLTKGKVWGAITKMLHMDIPVLYQEVHALNPSRVPAVCKVDFMVGSDGRFHIAEIDAHNKHGLGYSTLGARLRRAVRPLAAAFPGVAKALANELGRRNRSCVTLLYADQERFYLPEFRIFRDELAKHDVKMNVISEVEVKDPGKLGDRIF